MVLVAGVPSYLGGFRSCQAVLAWGQPASKEWEMSGQLLGLMKQMLARESNRSQWAGMEANTSGGPMFTLAVQRGEVHERNVMVRSYKPRVSGREWYRTNNVTELPTLI
jgi:hypothetical protein